MTVRHCPFACDGLYQCKKNDMPFMRRGLSAAVRSKRRPAAIIGTNMTPKSPENDTSAHGSVDPAQFETTLELARRHVAIGERLVSEQQALVDRLRANGETVSHEAERLLVNLKNTLALMHGHLAHE